MNQVFEVETAPVGTRVEVLRVRGKLDARSATVLMEQCARVRAAGRDLVLSLGGVTFIASSGVGALLALVEEFRQAEIQVRLAELSPAVESVVRLLNLDQFLAIDETEGAALSALEAR